MTGRSFSVETIKDALQGAYEYQRQQVENEDIVLSSLEARALTLKTQIHDTPWWQMKTKVRLRKSLRQIGRKILVQRMACHAAEKRSEVNRKRLRHIDDLASVAYGEYRIWLSVEDFSLLVNHFKQAPAEVSDG